MTADSDEFHSDILMGKLPANLRLEVVRCSDYGRQKTVGSVLKALRAHLRILEEVAEAGFTWSSQPPRGETTLWSSPPGRKDIRAVRANYNHHRHFNMTVTTSTTVHFAQASCTRLRWTITCSRCWARTNPTTELDLERHAAILIYQEKS
ncbi:hypothetical protein AAVH_30641 [Aphelenchoides avenae]|nr:hypothetical protein AAVH_30641 [Aphelenchus avenae]